MNYEIAYYIVATAMWIVAIIQTVPFIYDKCKENKKKREERREKKIAKEAELKAKDEQIQSLQQHLTKLYADYTIANWEKGRFERLLENNGIAHSYLWKGSEDELVAHLQKEGEHKETV